jgi:serine/threonine protein kinase/lipoprotein NlpI
MTLEQAFLQYLVRHQLLNTNTANLCWKALPHHPELFFQQIQVALLPLSQWEQHLFSFQKEISSLYPPSTLETFLKKLSSSFTSSSQEITLLQTPSQILQDLEVLAIKTSAESGETDSLVEKQKKLNLTPSFPSQNRYLFLKKLGEGGMGIVELVYDQLLNREVALKKVKWEDLKPDSLSPAQKILLWRLRQEAFITAFLEHPHIVPLYDLQQKETGELQFTMKKIEGSSLRTKIQEKRRLLSSLSKEAGEEGFLSIFFKVCNAVAYAHAKGVIHRDLKPENILIGEFGEVYVLDWGIAKRLSSLNTTTLSLQENSAFPKISLETLSSYETIGGIGTPGYMPPEQQEDASLVSPQSDIYALGKILKECFTLRTPYEEFEALQIQKRKAHRDSPELLPVIPDEILAIIEKATQDDPLERYISVKAFVQDIENYQKHLRISVKEYHFSELCWKWIQRNRHKLQLSAYLLGLCCVFASYLYWLKIQQKRAEDENQKQRYEQTYQRSKLHREKAQQYSERREEIPLKVKFLLDAFHELSQALSIQGESTPLLQELFALAETLVELTCRNENYLLAHYVVRELEAWPSITLSQRDRLFKSIKEAEGARLLRHKKRLQYWIDTLQQPKLEAGMRENALFEISKMDEKEIYDRIIILLKEGNQYFLKNTARENRKDEYYISFAQALGRIGNSQAGDFLIQSLERLTRSALSSKEGQASTIEYRIALTQALVYLQRSDLASSLERIRKDSGEGSLFWDRSKTLYKELLQGFSLEDLPSHLQDFETLFEQAQLYCSKGDYEKAIQQYTQAIQKDPESFIAYLSRGNTYNRSNKSGNKEAALLDYTQALQLDPQSAEAYYNRGNIYREMGKSQEALQDYNQALLLNPQLSNAYNNRALIYYDLKQFDHAISDFQQALQLNPEMSDAHNNLGILYQEQKEYNQALLHYNQALALHPQFFSAYINRGNLKRILEDFTGALQDYNQAITLDPNSSTAYVFRGINKYYSKDQEGALLDYNQALTLDPQNALAYFNRGLLKKYKGKFESALEDLEKAWILQKEQPLLQEELQKLSFHQILHHYRKKQWRALLKQINHFERYATSEHPEWSQIQQLREQAEEEVKKEK